MPSACRSGLISAPRNCDRKPTKPTAAAKKPTARTRQRRAQTRAARCGGSSAAYRPMRGHAAQDPRSDLSAGRTGSPQRPLFQPTRRCGLAPEPAIDAGSIDAEHQSMLASVANSVRRAAQAGDRGDHTACTAMHEIARPGAARTCRAEPRTDRPPACPRTSWRSTRRSRSRASRCRRRSRRLRVRAAESAAGSGWRCSGRRRRRNAAPRQSAGWRPSRRGSRTRPR